MSKKLKDANERPEPAAQRDLRITTAVEGIRFHSAKDKAKCQAQIDEMLAIQLKSMASSMWEDHRRQRDELQKEIFRLHDRIRNLSMRHAADLIDLSRPQTSAMTATIEKAAGEFRR